MDLFMWKSRESAESASEYTHFPTFYNRFTVLKSQNKPHCGTFSRDFNVYFFVFTTNVLSNLFVQFFTLLFGFTSVSVGEKFFQINFQNLKLKNVFWPWLDLQRCHCPSHVSECSTFGHFNDKTYKFEREYDALQGSFCFMWILPEITEIFAIKVEKSKGFSKSCERSLLIICKFA